MTRPHLPIAVARCEQVQRSYQGGIAAAPSWDFAPNYIPSFEEFAEACSRHDHATVYQAIRNRFYYRGVCIERIAKDKAELHPIVAWYDAGTPTYYEVEIRLNPFPRHSVHRFLTLKEAVYFLLHANLGDQSSAFQSVALPRRRQYDDYPKVTL